MINSIQRSTNITSELSKINISGNIIPESWYHHIVKSHGRPDLVAITILSEIVYWYRPSSDGSKKYAEDLLQKSYSELEEKYGFTRKQVLSAFETLESLSLVAREFRNVKIRGRIVPNIMYVYLDPIRLMEITEDTSKSEEHISQKGEISPQKKVTYPTLKVELSPIEVKTPLSRKEDISPSNTETYPNREADTNTINTIKTISDNTTEISPYTTAIQDVLNHIDIEAIKAELPGETAPILQEVVEVILDISKGNKKAYSVFGRCMPAAKIQSTLLDLKGDHLKYVAEYLYNVEPSATNRSAYITAVLYNCIRNGHTMNFGAKDTEKYNAYGSTGRTTGRKSSFHNFIHQDYDIDALEKILLDKQNRDLKCS